MIKAVGEIHIIFFEDGGVAIGDKDVKTIPTSQLCYAGYFLDEIIRKVVASNEEFRANLIKQQDLKN